MCISTAISSATSRRTISKSAPQTLTCATKLNKPHEAQTARREAFGGRFAIYFFLPEVPPNYKGTYKGLMKSIIGLVKNEPKLRLASFRGATAFAAFSAFWTTLVFHLEEAPFFASSDIAGAFGLIGAVGALAAALVGKLNGYLSTSKIIFYSIVTMLIAWGFFYQFGFTYWGLIIGVILIDLGLQAMHVSNQTIIFSLNAKASNRINTVYMTSYFIGGSLGTFLAAIL